MFFFRYLQTLLALEGTKKRIPNGFKFNSIHHENIFFVLDVENGTFGSHKKLVKNNSERCAFIAAGAISCNFSTVRFKNLTNNRKTETGAVRTDFTGRFAAIKFLKKLL